MITSFEVGAIFKIIDQASPVLRKILAQVRELNKVVEQVKLNYASLGKNPALTTAINETRLLGDAWKSVAEASTVANRALGRASRRAAALGAPVAAGGAGRQLALASSIAETRSLARAWSDVADAAARSSGAINAARAGSRGYGRGALPPAAGGAGGGGRGGGRHRPGWLGGAHFSSPGVGLPGGSHVHFRGSVSNGAAAALGLLGYGAYEDAQMEDAVFQLIYHSGREQNAENRNRFRKVIQDSMAESGYSLHDIVEAALQETRMFQATPEGGLVVLPEMLRGATNEARAKGASPEESMKSLIGLAHMTKQYSPEAIKKLVPAFAYLSTANPSSLGSIEKAAGYAVPLLQSSLEVDPMQALVLGTALTRAGITSTKSGTWLREMATRALPGTSLDSKTAFKRHEAALRALGLVDDKHKPTWFTDDKPDLMKMLRIAHEHAVAIPLDKRAGYERALFGAQGADAFSVLADDAVYDQVGRLQTEMNSPEFKNRYATFTEDYAAHSPVQQVRRTVADFNNVMMDIGINVLPPVTRALQDFDAVLKGIREHLPGADKDGKGGDKWKVGTRAIEGALVGAAFGSLVPGVGTVTGAVGGGVLGTVAGVIEGVNATKAAANQANEPLTSYNSNVVITGNAASQAAGSIRDLGEAIRGLPGAAPGGVFPGGTSKMNFLQGPKKEGQPVVIHTALKLNGRTFAQAVSEHVADLYNYPTQAPFHDGRQTWSPPDMQTITT